MMGARMTKAKGTKAPAMSRAPEIISQTFKKGKKYPEPASPPMNFPASSGRGGIGMKLKKPFNPKTKKMTPSSSLATNVTFFIRPPSKT